MLKLTEIAKNCEIVKHVTNRNKNLDDYLKVSSILPRDDVKKAYDVISSWPGYKPTPLVELNKIAQFCGIKSVLFKDESKRFDLKSFKALGGAYAVADLAKDFILKGGKVEDYVVTTATDGNHGRSVAWGARRLGLKCKIFISEFVSEARGQAMADLGADVIKVKGNYEKSLIECIKQSTENNWQIVQDVAWRDYIQVPTYTMAGYTVMMKEIADQIHNEKISHIILQAGVGGMAGAMIAGIAKYLNNIPSTIVVEPDSAACVLESIKTGKIEKIDIKRESLMGGMSCGEVSLVPWEILKNSVKHCISLPDDDIAKTMKLLGNSSFSDQPIIAGENSAPGVISLIASCEDQNIKQNLNLDQSSNVLLIGCEGDTDQEMYQKLINQN